MPENRYPICMVQSRCLILALAIVGIALPAGGYAQNTDCDLTPRLLFVGPESEGVSPESDNRFPENGDGPSMEADIEVFEPPETTLYPSRIPDGTPADPGFLDPDWQLEPPHIIAARCDRLGKAIVWVDGKGKEWPINDWTYHQVKRLHELYLQMAQDKEGLDLQCVSSFDLHNRTVSAQRNKKIYYTRDEAFDIYAAHVAHVLWTEVHGGLPWSILDSTTEEMGEILRSDRYFSYISVDPAEPVEESVTERPWVDPGDAAPYLPPGIVAGRDFMGMPESASAIYGVLCDPRDGYEFLSRRGLIGSSQRETLEKMIWYLRVHMGHLKRVFGAHLEEAQNVGLASRLRRNPSGYIPVAGCHGAADLVRDLARSINIPLLRARMLEPQFTQNILKAPVEAPRANFENQSHGSLCWQWTGTGARCIVHLDEIFAESWIAERFFPVSSTGTKLSAAEARSAFFMATWRTPEELRADGFDFNIHRIEKGVGLGRKIGNNDLYPHLGMTIGTWKMSDRASRSNQKLPLRLDGSYQANPEAADLWTRHHAHTWYSLAPLFKPFLYPACQAQSCLPVVTKRRQECRDNATATFNRKRTAATTKRDRCTQNANNAAQRAACQTEFQRTFDALSETLEKEKFSCKSVYPHCDHLINLTSLKEILEQPASGVPPSAYDLNDFRKRFDQVIKAYGSCDDLMNANARWKYTIQFERDLEFLRENP